MWTPKGYGDGQGWYKPPVSAPVGFAANAVHGDGVVYLATSSASGISDGGKGTLSFWMKPTAGDGTTRFLMLGKDTSSRVFLQIGTANTLSMTLRNSAAAAAVSIIQSTSAPIAVAGGWRHVAMSWDTSTSTILFYVDGVNARSSSSAITASDTIKYNNANWSVFSNFGASNFTGDLSEFYFNMHEFVDLSVPANLEKFRSLAGHPVDLGIDGSMPTGTRPELYLGGSHDYTNWQANLGTFGDFAVTGGSLSSATSP